MKKMLLPFCCSISFFAFDQTENKVPEVTESRHKIGVDLSPGFVTLLGGSMYKLHSGLLYQYKLNERYRFRASFNYSNRQSLYSDFSQPELLYIQNDTTHYLANSTSEQAFILRSGIQYNFGKRNFKPFVGLELLVGTYRYESDNYFYEYALDDNGGYLEEDIENGPLNRYYENSTYRHFNAGASVVAGFDWKFKPRWTFGTQLNFDFYMSILYRQEFTQWDSNSSSSTIIENNMTSFNFEATPFRLFLKFDL